MSDVDSIKLRRWAFDTREVDEYGNETWLSDKPKGENLTDEEALGIILSKDTLERLTKGQRTVVSTPQFVPQWEPPTVARIAVPLGVYTGIKAAITNLRDGEDRLYVADRLEQLLKALDEVNP